VRTHVKICGCTSWSDASLAIESGADAIGLIFAAPPRRITWEAARSMADRLPPVVTPVGVFVNPTHDELMRARDIFPNLVIQLSGDETPSFVSSIEGKVVKAIHVDPDGADADRLTTAVDAYPGALVMFDTKTEGSSGGTGRTFPWHTVVPIARNRPIVIAGGLTPENVAACVRAVRPFGVDVRSGVETDGKKDAAKMRAFVGMVREADAT
jgi:phosphoribosylanthranilate isomerase